MKYWQKTITLHWAAAFVLSGLYGPLSFTLIEHHQTIFWPLVGYLLLSLTFLQVIPAALCTTFAITSSAWLSLRYLHTERGALLLGEGIVLVICTSILFLRYTLHDARDKLQIISQQRAYLQLSEERFRQLLLSAPISVIVSDGNGKIVLANTYAADLFRYPLSVLESLEIKDLIPYEVRERHKEARERYYNSPYSGGVYTMGQGDYVFHHGDVRGLRGDGTTFPAVVHLGHIYLDHEILVIAIAQDLTHQHELQDAYLQLQSEKIRTQAAEEAVRERDTFLSITAHELKTPLTNLSGYAQLGQDLLESAALAQPPTSNGALRQQITRIMDTMTRQSAKMNILVDRLLDLGRLSSGTLKLELSPMDLAVVTAEALLQVKDLYPAHTIAHTLPKQILLVGDSLRLEQVLVNLLDNACKYSPPTEPVQLTLQTDQRHIVVTIADHGPGIPPDEREKVFQRFYQIGGNGRRTGLGLGLYLTREIVERHGGTIQLTDNRDEQGSPQGTRVLLVLPYTPPTASSEPEQPETTTPHPEEVES